jgi:hypothetical protein
MKNSPISFATLILAVSSLVSACTVAQLEARLEANPQCKEVLNPKTGALMPCPGSDKAFYREAGLFPAKTNITAANAPSTPSSTGEKAVAIGPAGPVSAPKANPMLSDCKPQIHKKTGGTLPCPAPD